MQDRQEGLWHEYARHARPLLLDGLLFLTTLAILLVGFVGLRALAASGYSTSYIDFLENIHFLAYALITAAFAFDMIMKVLSIIIGGHKQ